MNDNVHPVFKPILDAIAPNVRVNPTYHKKYPSVVNYYSDKNFNVRLKVVIQRTMKQVGITATDDQLNEFMDIIGNEAEGSLFEKKEFFNNQNKTR